MRTLAPIVEEFFDRVFPSLCLGCVEPLSPGRRPLLLCPRCRGRLQAIDPARSCRVCLRESALARPGLVGWTCEPCRRTPGPLDRLVVAWRYAPPLDAVILALKLRRQDFLARSLVEEAIPRGLTERLGPIDLVVSVPMPWPRRILRGVDASAELAAEVSRALGRPRIAPLRRATLAPRQTGGSREERLSRVESTLFPRPRRAAQVRDRRVLVVDDVVTTASTVRAMARALRRLGAASVSALAIGATPGTPATPPSRRR